MMNDNSNIPEQAEVHSSSSLSITVQLLTVLHSLDLVLDSFPHVPEQLVQLLQVPLAIYVMSKLKDLRNTR